MNMQSLSRETLSVAQEVAVELFPWEHEHQLALSASLDPVGHDAFYRERGLESVRCWTPVEAGRVGGLAMLYAYRARREELWLAWFGLRSMLRGCGAGNRTLEWLVAQARSEGREMMRLWTTDEAEYASAVSLYRRHGFVAETVPALAGENWRTWVFTLMLNGKAVVPWSAVAGRGELCGREAPSVLQLAA